MSGTGASRSPEKAETPAYARVPEVRWVISRLLRTNTHQGIGSSDAFECGQHEQQQCGTCDKQCNTCQALEEDLRWKLAMFPILLHDAKVQQTSGRHNTHLSVQERSGSFRVLHSQRECTSQKEGAVPKGAAPSFRDLLRSVP